MSLGLNDSDKTYIVSSISCVFKVDEDFVYRTFFIYGSVVQNLIDMLVSIHGEVLVKFFHLRI